MKRLLLIAAGATMIFALSCTRTSADRLIDKIASDTCRSSRCSYPVLYEGMLPMADAPGVRYRLVIGPGCSSGGKYVLRTDYPGSKEHGKSELDSGMVSGAVVNGMSVYKLSSVVPGNENLNFRINRDGSLTMLTPELQQAPSGLDYSLSRVL